MDILSFRFNKNNQIFILQYLKTNQSCIDLFDIILYENKDDSIDFHISGIIFDDLDYEYDFNANLTFDLSKADFAYNYKIQDLTIDNKDYKSFLNFTKNLDLKEIYNSLHFKLLKESE